MGVGVKGRGELFSKDAVFLTCCVDGGLEVRDGEEAGGVTFEIGGGEEILVPRGGREVPLPPPDAPVGTNSLANGLGWNPGLSFRIAGGEDVPDSGREGPLEFTSRKGGDMVG
jgi:hypothetical protein